MTARRPARIGRYEVLDRLGVGGMGAVYLASDPLLGRTVAIKILRTDDDELRERFAREARSAASLKHHHIVTIYDIGEDEEGRPFLAMEYIDGESMAEVIRRRAPLPLHQRLKYIIDLCDGLGYAHRMGIVHRDIKPANLMITSEGVLKVVDFGVARMVSSTAGLTRAGTLLGTVHYMSPEQADGSVVDHLSDIFAVGLVLYEILSYRKAYPGDSAPVVLHKIVNTHPPPIREFLPERDEELEDVVDRAIEKQRSRRYQDLRELASALERVRVRLEAVDADATVVQPRTSDSARRSASFVDAPAPTEVSPNAMPPSPRPAGAEPRHIRSLDAIAQRRAAQIAQCLAAAVEHFAAGRYDSAVEQCEAAILINPEETRALQLLEQAHEALQHRQIEQWLADAQAHLTRGELTRAEELVEQALDLRSDSAEAIAVRNQVRDTRRERERAADRARAVEAAVERARRNLEAGAFEAAARAATEALAYDPAHGEAGELRDRATAALDARRRQQEHDEAAMSAVGRAREVADGGDHSGALELLRRFDPPHTAVDEAIAEIEARVAALERQRREEAARLRALEEARRREQLGALRTTASAALGRGDYAGARAAVRQARTHPVMPGDSELERLCAEIESAIDAAEAAARHRASIDRHLEMVRRAIAAGDLAAASKSVEAAVSLAPDDGEAGRLQQHVRELQEAAAAAEVAAQRRAAVERQVKAARAAFATGDFAAAMQLVDATLALAPDEPDVHSLQLQIRQAIEAKERKERRRREAAEVAVRARELADAGDHAAALARLREFDPPHALVDEAIAEIEARVAALERQQREEAERARRRAAQEARRSEQLANVRAATSAALDRGDYKAARAAVRQARSQPLVPGDAELHRLCTDIETVIDKAEAAAQRQAVIERQMTAAKSAVAKSDFVEALRLVDAALKLAPQEAALIALQQQIGEAQERDERQRREAENIAARARELFAAAQSNEALRLLAGFEPHALVIEVERELRQQHEQRERQERDLQAREREAREQQTRERQGRERQERAAATAAAEADRNRGRAARNKPQHDRQRLARTQERKAPPEPQRDVTLATEVVPAGRGEPAVVARRQAYRWPLVIAAALLLSLVVGAVWWSSRDRTTDVAELPPSAPAPPAVRVSYANDLAAAREQLRNGDLVGAVRRALTIPSSAPEAGEALTLLGDLRSEAQLRAQNARRSAEDGGQTTNPSFSEAAAKDAEAAKLTQPQDLPRAVSLYEEAASLYRTAATAGASVEQIVQLARAELKANRIRPAITYALQVLEKNSGNAEALRLLRAAREQAQRLAQTAAADARRLGVSIDNSAAFKDAVEQQAAAARLTNPQDTLRAYDAFLTAASHYRDASDQFKADSVRRLADAQRAREQAEQRLQSGDLDGAAEAVQRAERLEPGAPALQSLRKRLADAGAVKSTATTSAEIEQALTAAAKISDDTEALKYLAEVSARHPNDARIAAALRTRRETRDNRVTDLLRRSQQAADAEAVDLLEQALQLDPSRQDVLGERDRRRAAITSGRVTQELRNLVARLEAAYEKGDVAEIIRIAPAMDAARLEAQFKSFSIRWDVEPCTARVALNGTTASLTCVIHETAQPAGIRARVQPTTQTRHFQLTNVNGAWRITAQQIQ